MEEINAKTTIKDFMEWFISQYDGNYLPSDFDHTIDRLQGYCLAKKDSEEYFILASALDLLRSSQNFFRVSQHYSKL